MEKLRVIIRKSSGLEIDKEFALFFSNLVSQLSGKYTDIPVKKVKEIISEKNNVFFVATEETKNLPIAFLCLVVMNLPQGKRYHIESVIVDSKYRGYKIGSKLIKSVVNFLNKEQAKHVSLTCNPTRKEALALYKKEGFTKANTNVYRYYL